MCHVQAFANAAERRSGWPFVAATRAGRKFLRHSCRSSRHSEFYRLLLHGPWLLKSLIAPSRGVPLATINKAAARGPSDRHGQREPRHISAIIH